MAVAEAPVAADAVTIPGGKGKAVRMKKGDTIKITNTHGTQVRTAPASYTRRAATGGVRHQQRPAHWPADSGRGVCRWWTFGRLARRTGSGAGR